MAGGPAVAGTLRVVCRADHGAQPCESCGGTGYLEVRLLRAPAHPASPCCQAPWWTDVRPDAWRCSACKKVYHRNEVAGW